jgi:hypothetical protein
MITQTAAKNLSSERQRSFPMVSGGAAIGALLLLGRYLFCSSEQLTKVYSGLFRMLDLTDASLCNQS